MILGTLHLRLPDGHTREFVIEKPVLTAGRARDNDLVIDHASIARRHARLEFEGGQMLVEDLGSSDGTYVGARQLQAHVPSAVGEDQLLRLGEVELRYASSAAARQAAGQMPPVEAAEHVPLPGGPAPEVQIVGPEAPITPDTAAVVTVTLHNPAPAADEFILRVVGTPADWAALGREVIPLGPGAQEQVTVTFQPPATAAAGTHAFSVVATGLQTGLSGQAEGRLEVVGFSSVHVSLQPARSHGRYQVVVENNGNTPAHLTLSGDNPGQDLLFAFETNSLALAPGTTASVPLRVSPRVPRRIGNREIRAFTVLAQPGEERPAETATGQLIIQPAVPVWLVPAVVLLLLAACIFAGAIYFRQCTRYFPNWPGCPASPPVINAFVATPATIQAGDLVVITWDVSEADSVELFGPEHAAVAANGLRVFTLHKTTAFMLRASNHAGTVEQALTVTVAGTPP